MPATDGKVADAACRSERPGSPAPDSSSSCARRIPVAATFERIGGQCTFAGALGHLGPVDLGAADIKFGKTMGDPAPFVLARNRRRWNAIRPLPSGAAALGRSRLRFRLDLEEAEIAPLLQPPDAICEVAWLGSMARPVRGVRRRLDVLVAPSRRASMRPECQEAAPEQIWPRLPATNPVPGVIRPRSATTRSASSSEKTPATHAAAYSPSPSPIAAAGSTPNDFQS